MQTASEAHDKLVAFVGAGASAVPPSSLPTWKQFNDLLLESLCDRLADYSQNREPTGEMLATFRARRDGVGFFAPDFQAQLVEDEIGEDYFRVWQSLETDVYGPVHWSLAELAARDRLAAVVTLNFDRLIETAFAAAGQRFQVFHDAAAFANLRNDVTDATKPLPIVKIHGSIEDTHSLVDTLRQRVVGRPADLEDALATLLRRYRWVFLGFSGADLSYDEHYLGILDAAAEAPGFTFVVRDAAKVESGVTRLLDAYGREKASLVEGDLAVWVATTFGLATPVLPAARHGDADPGAAVKDRVSSWANGLGPMAVVNVLYSMLRSAGMDTHALSLLRKTWKSYRSTDDTKHRSYGRYLYNHGVSLLDVGFVANPLARADDGSNLLEWKDYADRNAFEFLARSYQEAGVRAAGARLASVMAYRGEVRRAIALIGEVTDAAIATTDALEMCDVAISSFVIYDIVQLFGPSALQMSQCLDAAGRLGDEPRRAVLAAYLGHLLAYAGDFERAEGYITMGERIAERLDLRVARIAARTARGTLLSDTGHAPEAVPVLKGLADELRERDEVPLWATLDVPSPQASPAPVLGTSPERCRVLLALNRAAMLAGDVENMTRTLDELDLVATGLLRGYCPHYYIAHAQCLLTHGDGDPRPQAKDLLDRARQLGNEGGNPWPEQAAASIAKHARLS